MTRTTRLYPHLNTNGRHKETAMSANPAVAIIGGLRSDLVDDETAAKGRAMARALGAALAEAGLDLVVYSCDPDFVEADVVAGFAPAAMGEGPRVQILHPSDVPPDRRFDEEDAYADLFTRKPDPSDYWEASFYRSLGDVDGALLICGGRSTLVAGHVALSTGLPVAAIAGFGGGAERIWKAMNHHERYRDAPDIPAMLSQAVGEAPKIASALAARAVERRREREAASKKASLEAAQRMASRRLYAGWGALGVFLALFLIGLTLLPGGAMFTVAFVLVLVAAGVSGATVRLVRDASPDPSMGATALFGAISGLFIGLGYAIPPLLSREAGLTHLWDVIDAGVRIQFVLAAIAAFAAGFAFDMVMRRLQTTAEEAAESSILPGK